MDDAVAEVIERMEAGLQRLGEHDARRFFHQTYLRTTIAVGQEYAGDGLWSYESRLPRQRSAYEARGS